MSGRYVLTGITDTAEYEAPDVSGGADPFEAGQDRDEVGVFVTNNETQPLTCRLERATQGDETFLEGAVDIGGVSVPAGGETRILAADPDVPMGLFRTVIAFDSAPSGNENVVVDYQIADRFK